MQGQLTSPDTVREFLTAGNATVTIRSERTGSRFTYRVRVSDDGQVHFVSAMTGSDNEASFQYMGLIRGGSYRRGHKSRIDRAAPSATAFGWFYAHLQAGRLPAQLSVFHEGKCGRCGRKLTVPESIERGLGPECAGRVTFECEAA